MRDNSAHTHMLTPRIGLLVAVVLQSCTATALGQTLSASVDMNVQYTQMTSNGPVLFVPGARSDRYSANIVWSHLRELSQAAFNLALEDDVNFAFPQDPIELFTSGEVVDPRSFWNPGDTDPGPTTINNNILNGINSAQISFEYRGAGEVLGDPENPILFIDNSLDNNAGLGWFAVDDGRNPFFVPASPRIFSQLSMLLTDDAPTIGTPFAMPSDAVVLALVGPHRVDLQIESSVTQEVIDIADFSTGAPQNSFGCLASGGISMRALVSGPSASTVPITMYVQFQILARSPISGRQDSLFVLNGASASTTGFLAVDTNLLSTIPGANMAAKSGQITVLGRQTFQAGESDFVQGFVTQEWHGVSQLTLDIPPNNTYSLPLTFVGGRGALIRPDSEPGSFASAQIGFDVPFRQSPDQVKFYLPEGYTLSVTSDRFGPTDLVLVALRGDHDLDGVIGPSDHADFVAAYNGPLPRQGHIVADFTDLQTFDFDGQGDIDCSDYAEFLAAWNTPTQPPPFSPCDTDADGDGVADGDDACPGTGVSALVDQIGCPFGDFNTTGAIDDSDLASLIQCTAGPIELPKPPPVISNSECLSLFDHDGDFDVDLADYATAQLTPNDLSALAACVSGAGQNPTPDTAPTIMQCLNSFDSNDSATVDLEDYAEIQRIIPKQAG